MRKISKWLSEKWPTWWWFLNLANISNTTRHLLVSGPNTGFYPRSVAVRKFHLTYAFVILFCGPMIRHSWAQLPDLEIPTQNLCVQYLLVTSHNPRTYYIIFVSIIDWIAYDSLANVMSAWSFVNFFFLKNINCFSFSFVIILVKFIKCIIFLIFP